MRPVLITAGATRNYLDSIRFISNAATGKTGLWIANQFPPQVRGHFLWGYGVDISPLTVSSWTTEEFSSTRDLERKMLSWVDANPKGLILHSAAVGDFEVFEINGKKLDWSQEKLDSTQAIQVTLAPTPKIVDQLKQKSEELFLVSFKQLPPHTSEAEASRIGRAQLERTRSDLVFTNVTLQLDRCQILDSKHQKIFTKRSLALEQLMQELFHVLL